MFVHALSGAASFAACLRLFRSYPLAVSPWSGDGRRRSIVLRHPGIEENRAGGGCDFFILSQDQADHFVLRPWGPSGSRRVQRRRVPGNPAGRAGARRRPPGDSRGNAGPARRHAARLGQRPAGDRRVLGVPRAAARPVASGTADQGTADGRQRPAALARVHREPAGRRSALGLPRPGRTRRSRSARRRSAGQRVLGALAEHPPRRPRARLRRRQGEPLRRRVLAAGGRLHGPLDAPRGRSRAPGEAPPLPPRHHGPCPPDGCHPTGLTDPLTFRRHQRAGGIDAPRHSTRQGTGALAGLAANVGGLD